jgi:hypothetical protein
LATVIWPALSVPVIAASAKARFVSRNRPTDSSALAALEFILAWLRSQAFIDTVPSTA